MKKTSFWVILIAAVAVLAGGVLLWQHLHHTDAAVANVYLDGELVRSVDLNKVTEPETFTVTGPVGDNVIEIEPGRIRVGRADCPDQVCVDMGWLTPESVMPIVCLPNRLIIELADAAPEIDGAEIDGVVG